MPNDLKVELWLACYYLPHGGVAPTVVPPTIILRPHQTGVAEIIGLQQSAARSVRGDNMASASPLPDGSDSGFISRWQGRKSASRQDVADTDH